jgi:hypothetical protein
MVKTPVMKVGCLGPDDGPIFVVTVSVARPLASEP